MKTLFSFLFKTNKTTSLNTLKDFENFSNECRKHLFEVYKQSQELDKELKDADSKMDIVYYSEVKKRVTDKQNELSNKITYYEKYLEYFSKGDFYKCEFCFKNIKND